MKKEFDLAAEMYQNLEAPRVNQTTQAAEIESLIYSLNRAASLLDELSFHKSSEIVTRVLEKVAQNYR